MLVAERVRLNTYRVLAIYSDQEVLSNVLWTLKITTTEADVDAKILALWLNSTMGILLLLPISEVTEGPWIGIKKAKLNTLPVLDTRKLSLEQKSKLINLYKNVGDKSLKPLPDEFLDPEIRYKIDYGILNTFGLDSHIIMLEELYKLLAQDPMISLKSC